MNRASTSTRLANCWDDLAPGEQYKDCVCASSPKANCGARARLPDTARFSFQSNSGRQGRCVSVDGGEARALRSPCMPYGDLLSSLQIHQTSHFNGNGVEAVQCSCEARRYADLVLLAVVAVDFRLKLRRVPLCESHHAAKAEVVRSGIDVTFSACTRHVPGTILIRTQKRAAAMHFLLLPWFRWVV